MKPNTIETVLNQSGSFGVSQKYAHVSTAELVKQFTDAGYTVRKSSVKRVIKPERDGFQKHMIRVSHPELTAALKVGDSMPEVVLVNSHDGTSSLQLLLGLYRLVCANGLVVGSSFQEYRIRHTGNAIERALSAAAEVKRALPELNEKIQRFSAIELTRERQIEFAAEAAKLVLPESAVVSHAPIDSLLRTRRTEDAAPTAWNVFNRIQEAALTRGVQYHHMTPSGQLQSNTTRAIRSIDRQVKVNRSLWNLMEKIAA